MAIRDVECCDVFQVHDELVQKVNSRMPDEDELYDLAELFKVLEIPPESGSCMCSLRRSFASVTLRRP